MMHRFEKEDIVACLKGQRLAFIGDSTTRQLFWSTARKLGFQGHEENEGHADHHLDLQNVSVQFVWDPYLNSSGLSREIIAASLSAEGADLADNTAILLVGGGLWHARYLDEDYLSQFEDSLTRISQLIPANSHEALEKRYFQPRTNGLDTNNLIVFAPVPVLAYESLSKPRAATITPDKVEAMKNFLEEISSESQIPVAWSFEAMTASQESAYQVDGLHVTEAVASSMTDVLLNAKCNAVLRHSRTKKYPMDKTCCNSYDVPNWTQTLILDASMGVLPLLVLATYNDPARLSFLPSRKVLHAVLVLGLSVSYCFYADRTHLFNKAQKYYTRTEFWTLCSTSLLLGILSIRRSTITSQNKSKAHRPQAQDEPFLSRDQTDEWKGWMQLMILTYHYTGASKILWIYRIIRLLVASYLSMSGFGHTVFFYRKADYSLRRCTAVLVRLNLLSCVLPYVMRTDYLFYYFAPLISFWFVIIYLTMAIGHNRNQSLLFLVAKLFVSATLVNTWIRVPGSFEAVFYILEKLCNIHWDVNEWRFRVQLDSYIVYVGMLCAISFIRVVDALRLEGPVQSSWNTFIVRHLNHIRIAAGVIAIMGLPMFFVLASKSSSKEEYNGWGLYISAVPILSFVILRNYSRHLRNFHSSIFAWVGRHSLETFTLQFHIWLAADTKGLLALGVVEKAGVNAVVGKKFDMMVLTILFFWACWHVAAATQTLTDWIVGSQEEMEDVEIDEDTDSKEMGLLATKIGGDMANGLENRAFRWARRVKRLVFGQLAARIVIILLVMWLINVVDA